jgi:hypothetical protein
MASIMILPDKDLRLHMHSMALESVEHEPWESSMPGKVPVFVLQEVLKIFPQSDTVQSRLIEVSLSIWKEGRKGHGHVTGSVFVDWIVCISWWDIDYIFVVVKWAAKDSLNSLSDLFSLRCGRSSNVEHASDKLLVAVKIVIFIV